MVAHHPFEVVGGELAFGLDPQGHVFALALGDPSEPAVGLALGEELVEVGPYAGVAAAEGADVGDGICAREVEVLVLSVEETLLAGEGNHVFGVEGLGVVEGEGVYAGVVGVAADVAVGDAAGNPYGAFVGLALADEFHDPDFVGVGD